MSFDRSQIWRLLGALAFSLAVHLPAAYLGVWMLTRDRGSDEGLYRARVALITPSDEAEPDEERPLLDAGAIEPEPDEAEEQEPETTDEAAEPPETEAEPLTDRAIEDDQQGVEGTAPLPATRPEPAPEPAPDPESPTAEQREEDRRYDPPEKIPRGQVVETEPGGSEAPPKDPEYLSDRNQTVAEEQRARDPGPGKAIRMPPRQSRPSPQARATPPLPPNLRANPARPSEAQRPAKAQPRERTEPRPAKSAQAQPRERTEPRPAKSAQAQPRERTEPRPAKSAQAQPRERTEPRPAKSARAKARPRPSEPARAEARPRDRAESRARPASRAQAPRPDRPPSGAPIEPPLLDRTREGGPGDSARDRGSSTFRPLFSVFFVPVPRPTSRQETPSVEPPSPPTEAAAPSRPRPRIKARRRARSRAKVQARPRDKVRPQVPRTDRPEPEVQPEPTPRSESEEVAQNDPRAPADEADEARQEPRPPPQVDLRPSFSILSQTLGGPWLDHIEDAEDGEANLLSTAAWRHAPFLMRFKRQVAQHWHPDVAMNRHDPGARMYGHRDRETIVRVVLNADGSLERVYVIRGSGAEFLDNEAVRAIRAAAPFPNPPQGLVDPSTGHIVFNFGFNLTMGERPLFRLRRHH